MSCRNYGVYLQGAIIKKEDFDPAKVIIAVCEGIYKFTLPDDIKTSLYNNEFNREIAEKLCTVLEIAIEDIDSIYGYSDISDKIISNSCLPEWYADLYPPLIGSSEVEFAVFNEIEGDYYYAGKNEDEYIEDCYMFSLFTPFVWDIGKYTGCRTKAECVQQIREAAKTLLKDDIDWEKRLGYLIGSEFSS